jgi:hypothetical protein
MEGFREVALTIPEFSVRSIPFLSAALIVAESLRDSGPCARENRPVHLGPGLGETRPRPVGTTRLTAIEP